jgi:hypothetical protein
MYNVIDQKTGNVIYRAWSFTEASRIAFGMNKKQAPGVTRYLVKQS